MILDSLKYPFKDEKWIEKGLKGSLLMIGTIFLIPAFTLLGYLLRVMREDSLPEFNNLVEMTVEGFKAALIAALYLALPLTIFLASSEGPLLYIGAFSYLLGAYLVPSIFYQISNHGWKSAFTKKVFKNAFTLKYFFGNIAAGIVSYLILIPYVLSLILIAPIILFPAVYLYIYVFMFRVMKIAIESE